ncbi:CAF17-like 4Fe-4S cluster assembly/insertion protein YgfZ [Tritonibacter horizontis]|uniref:tRNA-modifying protein YgfZ n=1 Tax=Tritonibacter horizontis TaxID=1768241 RepID=A0A132BY04_9RHOB|nr:folate-binding protein YgfZ [Tritonibacter horizontis]KUP93271.1 tRNA-modifying protein YgfZ [Tritonibacter horizontis]
MSDRHILRLSGSETRDFLQGLVTNDVRRLDQGLVYAALLTPQGKYLADFFLVPEGDAVLFDVAETLAAPLAKRLAMYRLRADVQIEDTDLKLRRGTGEKPDGAFDDPRHPALGWRLYGVQDGDDGSDWDAIRVAHCIPETGVELTPDSYILEVGFERLNGVDFRKGCYVGQEVTARMKHKTELRKGLQRVEIDGTAPLGATITANDKPVGQVFTQANGAAIAYLRYDRAKGPLEAEGGARLVWQGTD